jgi:ArsR family transcriptional regulator, zinc-responsive transcriptional repressor
MPDTTSLHASSHAPTPDLDDLTKLFRVLSDPVRLRILLLLAGGERNVTSLCTATGLAQPTVSHHLGLLRLASLAEARRSGKSMYYSPGTRIRIDDGTGSICFQAGTASTAELRTRSTSAAEAHSPVRCAGEPVEPATS